MSNRDINPGINPQGNPEGAFQRLEAAYQTLLELDSNAIMVVRPADFIILEANRECIKMLGYEGQQLVGMCVSDIMIELPERLKAETGKIDNSQDLLLLQETIWRHHDGQEIPVLVNAKRINGSVEPIVIVIARDMREIRAKESALIASDARYHDLVEHSGEGLGIVDADEYFTFANPAASEIFGLPADKMIGQNLNSFLDHQAIEEIKVQTAIRQAGQRSIYELEIIRPDGERRWLIVTATPQYDADRKFISTLGIFRDITERKLAETKVRESEKRLHAIVDLTNDWIWEVDPKWKYTFVSPKIFDILGYQPDELIGRSPFEFLLPEDVSAVQEELRNLVHQFKPLNALVNRAKHKDGHLVYLETCGIAVFSEQGVYKGYRGADRDITLRKLYEHELIVAKEKAEESDRLKSSILANMSHELRTPLNGILGFAEILKEELRASEYESMVDNIYNSGQRLMSTLNSIIILSQLEAGKIKVTEKPILLEQCIDSVVKQMMSLSAEKNIFINTAGIRNVAIVSDEYLIKQLLLQIIDNAIKFTDHGGVTIEAYRDTEAGRNWGVVKVSDTGIGIDKTNNEFIFQEFRQVSEGFGRKYQGSGIGLTISKKIIGLLGGRITVESEPGKGSCFIIRIPSEYSSQDAVGADPVVAIQPSGERKAAEILQLPQLLLVEDNIVNKQLTVLFLRNIYRVDYAPDAVTALEMVRVRNYAAILMDINLGYGMNGIEATREIRKLPGYAHVPIIAVTGYTMADDVEQLMEAGCTGHIAKPFTKQTLLKILQEELAVTEQNNPLTKN